MMESDNYQIYSSTILELCTISSLHSNEILVNFLKGKISVYEEKNFGFQRFVTI